MNAQPAGRRANVRFFKPARWRFVAARLPVVVSGPFARVRLLLVLARGFMEMRFPALRTGRVRSFEIGNELGRRRVHVRSNGADAFTFYEVFVKGVYDRLLPLRAGDVILDLGANIGMASAYFDYRCPGVRIIAVEPEPANCELWRLNVPSQAATLVEGALSAQAGEAALAINRSTTNRLVTDVEQGDTVVKTVTLDTLAELAGSPITLIKCDIEGAEGDVFARSWDALKEVRTILMEVHGRDVLRVVDATLSAEGFERQPELKPGEGEVIAFTRG